jgi:hypothetical protein
MQGRWETTHTAPRFFSHLPRTPSTHFPFPSPSKAKNKTAAELYASSGNFRFRHEGYRTPFAATGDSVFEPAFAFFSRTDFRGRRGGVRSANKCRAVRSTKGGGKEGQSRRISANVI